MFYNNNPHNAENYSVMGIENWSGWVLFNLHFLFYALGLDLNFDDAFGLK